MAASSFVEQATQPVLTLIAVTPFAAYIASVKIGLGSFSDKPVDLHRGPGLAAGLCVRRRRRHARRRPVEPRAVRLGRRVARWEVLWHLRLPSALPSLFTAAKYNIGLALVVAYLAEGGDRWASARSAPGRRQQRGRPAVGGDPVDGDSRDHQPGAAQRARSERSMGWHASQRTQHELTRYGARDGRPR